jgi:hypothetical protein
MIRYVKFKLIFILFQLYFYVPCIGAHCLESTAESKQLDISPYDQELFYHVQLSQERAELFKDARADTIITIDNHSEILNDIDRAIAEHGAENIIVVYDIDDCVTYPDHAACLPGSYSDEHKATFQGMIEDLDPIQKCIVWNLKYREPKSLLTDDALPAVLKTLKDSGVSTLGLTASLAGAVKSPTDCQQLARFQTLQRLEIEFNAPDEEIILEQFPKFHQNHPVYYRGIGFAQTSENFGSTTKGEFFIALMQRWNKKPKAVLFIDDSMTNLNRFAHTMRQNEINCSCYQFISERVHTKKTISAGNYSRFINQLIIAARKATQH